MAAQLSSGGFQYFHSPVSLGAVVFMVPMFKRMYAGLGEDLFWLTRALVKLSDSLRFNPEAWILGTLFSGAIIIFVCRKFGWD